MENIQGGAMSVNETSGLQGRVTVKIMVMAYKKDKALCSPTSALEKKRINVERGAEESFQMDNDTLI